MKEKLSKQQKKICAHLMLGKRNDEIAIEMALHCGTIKFHIGNIFKILGAKNRSECIIKLLPYIFPDKSINVSTNNESKQANFEYIHALLQ